MENLSYEKFWTPLYEKYPKGVQEFCDWIDEYKKNIGWSGLFSPKAIIKTDDHGLILGCHEPKYHHLPLAMQIGIWIEFVCSRGGCEWEINDLFSHDWEKEITGYCKIIHEENS